LKFTVSASTGETAAKQAAKANPAMPVRNIVLWVI
jgi:hypothetical protein